MTTAADRYVEEDNTNHPRQVAAVLTFVMGWSLPIGIQPGPGFPAGTCR